LFLLDFEHTASQETVLHAPLSAVRSGRGVREMLPAAVARYPPERACDRVAALAGRGPTSTWCRARAGPTT
jgi:hypothetical protein